MTMKIEGLTLYEVFWRNKHSGNIWSMNIHAPTFAHAEMGAIRIQEGNYQGGRWWPHEEIVKITKDFGVDHE